MKTNPLSACELYNFTLFSFCAEIKKHSTCDAALGSQGNNWGEI